MKKEIILSQNQKDLMNEAIQFKIKEIELQDKMLKALVKDGVYIIKKKGNDIVFDKLYYIELLTEEERKLINFNNKQILYAR